MRVVIESRYLVEYYSDPCLCVNHECVLQNLGSTERISAMLSAVTIFCDDKMILDLEFQFPRWRSTYTDTTQESQPLRTVEKLIRNTLDPIHSDNILGVLTALHCPDTPAVHPDLYILNLNLPNSELALCLVLLTLVESSSTSSEYLRLGAQGVSGPDTMPRFNRCIIQAASQAMFRGEVSGLELLLCGRANEDFEQTPTSDSRGLVTCLMRDTWDQLVNSSVILSVNVYVETTDNDTISYPRPPTPPYVLYPAHIDSQPPDRPAISIFDFLSLDGPGLSNDSSSTSSSSSTADLVCIICHDVPNANPIPNSFVHCRTCNQPFHRLCIAEWARTRWIARVSDRVFDCPHCRGDWRYRWWVVRTHAGDGRLLNRGNMDVVIVVEDYYDVGEDLFVDYDLGFEPM